MEFVWSESGDTSIAEIEIWKALKIALANDEGICYHRYPIFSADRSRREPDILILHRQWGLYVIECKGYDINNIERINGPVWVMKDWHSSQETPYTQAEDQMWAILGKFRNESCLRKGRQDIIQGHVFIGLPFITRSEWRDKGLDLSPASPLTIIFADDLDPHSLRNRLQDIPAEERQEPLTEEQWKLALAILQGAPVLHREARPEPKKRNIKAFMLKEVEKQILSIDRDQHKIAVQIPSGPQRIRGLAGSGKTVVMCMKTAWMHLRFPNWDIAYTFYTRSLYGMIRNLITRFYRYWADQNPNWEKIHIFHGWGAKDLPGMYRFVANAMQRNPRSYTEAKNVFLYKEQNELLGKCCKELLEGEDEIPVLFDAILIDEGQDFHFDFYKLCYHVLREPKRLIWAYDEVQSLESLSIPTTIDIFGTNSDGSPIVNLEGTYPDGEVEKDIILSRCYRTPRPVLVTAHIFGMGLLRPQGAVQFIPTPGGWEDIGYEICSGTFEPGQKLTIRRPEANSPHLLEKLAGYQDLVQWKVFPNREQELSWVAEQIAKNIYEDELRPEEIVVISLDWKNMDKDLTQLIEKLKNNNVQAIRPGIETGKEEFQKQKHVTLTGIFPAKGNEASIVYVIGFEQVDSDPLLIVQQRNQAFTAITRTRGWCILTGLGEKAEALFREIEMILANPEQITFVVPDPKVIQRNLDNLEYERRRNRIKKAQDLTNQLARILREIDDPALRNRLIKKLQDSSS
ncbi:MAG: NERD domain-containing protein [Syntrophothermus sp.]|uniref:NERD domain-containing protein n=1 Tax=Syntrophothermus sp. TaxID=2736299 RepID=UPI002579A169|nr:nuclease-related domain-containing DEAD/DEAH box helicase [Syntrophothermus sp.]NSW84422.1 NERD domain-containing protein [Syntrophothermus sp.]